MLWRGTALGIPTHGTPSPPHPRLSRACLRPAGAYPASNAQLRAWAAHPPGFCSAAPQGRHSFQGGARKWACGGVGGERVRPIHAASGGAAHDRRGSKRAARVGNEPCVRAWAPRTHAAVPAWETARALEGRRACDVRGVQKARTHPKTLSSGNACIHVGLARALRAWAWKRRGGKACRRHRRPRWQLPGAAGARQLLTRVVGSIDTTTWPSEWR